MNKLNVFNCINFKWTSISGICANLRNFFRSFKYAYQRVTRGYSDRDTWNLDIYLSYLMSGALHHLADNTHSYPIETENGQQWSDLLHIAAEDARLLNEGEFPLVNPYSNDYFAEIAARTSYNFDHHIQTKIDQLYWEREEQLEKKRMEHKDRLYDFLKKYHYDLWD